MDGHDAIGEREQTRSLRAPSSEPSLSHTTGEKVRSPSRKRQRLDSGSSRARSMSADHALSEPDKAAGSVDNINSNMDIDTRPTTPPSTGSNGVKPAQTPSRVTINVREHPKGLDDTDLNGRRDSHASHITTQGQNGTNGVRRTMSKSSSASQSASPPSSASPLVEEIDPNYEDVEGEDQEPPLDEAVLDSLRSKFPFTQKGDYGLAAEQIYSQLDRGLDFGLVQHLNEWMLQVQTDVRSDSDWLRLIYGVSGDTFWDSLIRIYSRLLTRPWREISQSRPEEAEDVMRNCLTQYAVLIARILKCEHGFLRDNIVLDKDMYLSARALNIAKSIFKDEKGFNSRPIIVRGVDGQNLRLAFVNAFITAGGARCLATLVGTILDNDIKDDTAISKLNSCITFAVIIGCWTSEIYQTQPSTAQSVLPRLADDLLKVFEAVDKKLNMSLDKQQDVLSLDMRRQLIEAMEKILYAIFGLKLDTGRKVFRNITGREEFEEKTAYALLTVMTWKIKLMNSYIREGRMELRLFGIDTMATLLVTFFNENKDGTHSLRTAAPNSLLVFVADILLEEQVVDYLTGVSSHPTIISRSSNVLGFLVVTNKVSRQQTELLWRTITDSQDPRIVQAAYQPLQSMIQPLANLSELVTLCSVIMASPFPIFSPSAADFFRLLFNTIQNKHRNYVFDDSLKDDDSFRIPMELAIQLLRCLASTGMDTQPARFVHEDATHTLAILAPLASAEVRASLLKTCMNIARESTEDGATCASAMYLMIKDSRSSPKELAQELKLVPVMMKDFVDFVAKSRGTRIENDAESLNNQLAPRLDLIWYTVPADDSINETLLRQFWSHLVGADSLSHLARDVAWNKLSLVAFYPGAENAFLEKHQELLSPTQIKPEYFTSGFFSFIQKLTTSRITKQPVLHLKDNGAIDIPEIDLVWNSLMTAPSNVNDDSTIQYLCATYLDKSFVLRLSKQAVEETHVALVSECLDRLAQSHKQIRDLSSSATNGDADDVAMADASAPHLAAELVFLRTVKFLRRFLLHIRARPEFGAGTTMSEMDEERPQATCRGSTITVKCEIMRLGMRGDAKYITIGGQDTTRQLHRQISAILTEQNVCSFQLFTGGKRVHLLERPRMTLEEIGIARAPHLIIREGNSNDENRKEHVLPKKRWRSAFEQRLVSRLDDLYALLDGADVITSATFDFMKHLPRIDSLKALVGEVREEKEQLFPMESPYKISYLLDCLRETLDDAPEDRALIVHGTRLLENLLLQIKVSESGPVQSDYLLDTVACLYDFVIASQGKDVDVFISPAAVMRKVLAIGALGLPTASASMLVWDCYALSIEMFQQSAAAFAEFEGSANVHAIHQQLLFETTSLKTRYRFSQLIRRKIETFAVDSKVPLGAFLRALMSSLESIIPMTTESPDRAGEIFDIVTFAFNSLVLGKVLTPPEIQKFFVEWSRMLVSHTHVERLGRDEADVVLFGLARLLRIANQGLQSEIPLAEKEELISTIWWKFLFQKAPENDEELWHQANQLPVLESTTRTELMHLAADLSGGDEGLALLSDLASQIQVEHKWLAQVDQPHMLRSNAGFVGMRNLGQTCYMNSLITNLFMNPVFRDCIMSCNPNMKRDDAPFLWETQRLFSEMQRSSAKSVDPSRFVEKIITFSGQPVDVGEQMDVDEFMNTLFTRWEDQMPSFEVKERFKSIYTCKTVQQVKSKECIHVSERVDPCLAISCDVQGKSTLEESLKAFTEGDVMEGDNKWQCEACGKKVDAVKRTCLKEMPDHLMFQLKRFTWDFELGLRYKVHDRFVFPMSIDMNQFTFENLSDSDEKPEPDYFDLVGIIVHKGQAEHGHYVSYIKARPSSNGEAPWMLFDDSDVSPFDPNNLAEASFGGPMNKDTGGMFQSGLKTYNAYMLFYQRRSSMEETPWAKEEQSGDIQSVQSVPLPVAVEEEIVEQNRTLIKDYSLFDQSYRNFITYMIRRLGELDHSTTHNHDSAQARILTLVMPYLVSTWARTRDLPGFDVALTQLRDVCRSCDKCCWLTLAWLISSEDIESEVDPLRDMVLKINQPKVRNAFRYFIGDSLGQLRNNSDLYGADVGKDEPALRDNGVFAFVTRLSVLIPDSLHWNFRAWDDFFGLLGDIASLGRQECYALIQAGFLTRCFEILLLNATGISEETENHYMLVLNMLKRRPVGPLYNSVVRLVALLCRHIDPLAESVPDAKIHRRLDFWTEDGIPWTDEEERIVLDNNPKEGGLVFLCEVLQKWNFSLESTDNTFWPGLILRKLLSGKAPLVAGVVRSFEITIGEFEPRYADPFLRATPELVSGLREDSLLLEVVTFMKKFSREANGTSSRHNDGYDGFYCYGFWHQLWRLHKGDIEGHIKDVRLLDQMILGSIATWAPTLLCYSRDSQVGSSTRKLVKDIMFSQPEALIRDDVRKEYEQDKAVQMLFWACDRQMRMWISYDELPWKQFVEPMQDIMKACAEYVGDKIKESDSEDSQVTGDLPGEEEKVVRRWEDDIKAWYEKLPLPSDNDLALGQSGELTTTDWEQLEIGDDAFAETSDITEQSDDEIGTLMPNDVDM